jgi:hypothetical protein
VSFCVNATRIPGDNDKTAPGYLFTARVGRAEPLVRGITRTAHPDRALPEQALVALIEQDWRSLLEVRKDRRIALEAQEHRANTALSKRLSLNVDVIPLIGRELIVEITGCLRALLAKLTS